MEKQLQQQSRLDEFPLSDSTQLKSHPTARDNPISPPTTEQVVHFHFSASLTDANRYRLQSAELEATRSRFDELAAQHTTLQEYCDDVVSSMKEAQQKIIRADASLEKSREAVLRLEKQIRDDTRAREREDDDRDELDEERAVETAAQLANQETSFHAQLDTFEVSRDASNERDAAKHKEIQRQIRKSPSPATK